LIAALEEKAGAFRMTIPGFQDIMLPLLRIASDGREYDIGEVSSSLADQFALTLAERTELLPSGRQARFDNRVGWARTYLSKARLIERTVRGKFRITNRGQEVLQNNPARIDLKFLMQYPEIVEFRHPLASDTKKQDNEIEESENIQTPEEVLEGSYQNIRRTLTKELLESIMACSPKFFEKLVVDLLLALGYGGSRRDAGQAIGQSGDGGVDGIIKEDRLGLDIVYIQAKRWDRPVGRPIVQGFAGSLEGFRARKGVLITTSRFTSDADAYVQQIEKKIVLIDGEQLVQYMIDYGVGVTQIASYTIKRVDTDYFSEED
jgi:restriction system protein